MKYAIIIADGAADLPVPELGLRTPFEAARTPNLDALAAAGRLGTAVTTPPGFLAGSDVCTMSLLGYDPAKYHTGRAPLEAASIGVPMADSDWIFRLNLVTVGEIGSSDDGLMLDHSAGAISDAEAKFLIADLYVYWQAKAPQLARQFSLTHGVSYRSILADRSGRSYSELITTPPHEIPRQPWAQAVPRAASGSKSKPAADSAAALVTLMNLAGEMLPEHAINMARRAAGKRPANMAWVWGQGTRPRLAKFHDRFGLTGSMTTAVDLLAGIAALIGWHKLPVAGVTSYHDNDYAAQARATVSALDDYDIVCCHIEAPDEMSHQGDYRTKVASIEAIDELVVGPIVAKLRTFGEPELGRSLRSPNSPLGWRILVLPDHYTLVSTRKHDATPVPFLMCGTRVPAQNAVRFSERNCAASDLHIAHGHELMEYFLKGGRAMMAN